MYTHSNSLRNGIAKRVKLVSAAVVAILIAGTAVSAPQEQTATAKADRLQSNSIEAAACARETWPYISKDCLENEASGRNKTRTMRYVTVDRIIAPNTTALMRLPVIEDARIR